MAQLAKIIISAGLLVYIFISLDIDFNTIEFRNIEISTVIFCSCLVFVQIALLSLRFEETASLMNVKLGPLKAYKLNLISLGFGQIFLGTVGQDLYKFSIMKKECDWKKASIIIILDRAIGFLSLFYLIFLVCVMSRGSMADDYITAISGGVLVLNILLLRLDSSWFEKKRIISAIGRYMTMAKKVFGSPKIIILATLSHLLSIVLFCFIFHVVSETEYTVALLQNLALGLLISLGLSSIPISAGGWGVREGYLIFHLANLGLNNVDILATSIAFGLLWALSGLVGMGYWAFRYVTAKGGA